MSDHLRLVDHSELVQEAGRAFLRGLSMEHHPTVAAASPPLPPGPSGTPPESLDPTVVPPLSHPAEVRPGAPPHRPNPLRATGRPRTGSAAEAGGDGGSPGVGGPPSGLPPFIIVTEVRGQRRWFKVVEVDCGRIAPRGPLVVAECHDRTSADRVCAALNAWAVR